MSENFNGSVNDLLDHLLIKPEYLPYALEEKPFFSFKLTKHWISKIKIKDPLDPLLLQILPFKRTKYSAYVSDPLRDQKNILPGGIIHRYPNRALWLITGACAIHCQYCFRQFFPYQLHAKNSEWKKGLDYLKRNHQIHEVILSGGDPLTLSDEKIKKILDALQEIRHLRSIRIHTRQITLSSNRINQKLLFIFNSSSLPISIISHVNHSNELDAHSFKQFQSLYLNGVRLLNQSVLLNQVNHQSSILIDLSYKLYRQYVLPYYLHRLDPVKGAENFYLNDQKIRLIYQEMQQALPGHLLPKLVKDNCLNYKSIYGNLII